MKKWLAKIVSVNSILFWIWRDDKQWQYMHNKTNKQIQNQNKSWVWWLFAASFYPKETSFHFNCVFTFFSPAAIEPWPVSTIWRSRPSWPSSSANWITGNQSTPKRVSLKFQDRYIPSNLFDLKDYFNQSKSLSICL